MLKIGHAARKIRRLMGLAFSLVVLGFGGATSRARDAGAPENLSPRDNYRYSLDYYRNRGDFGRPGGRMKADDPRGHMSHGHGPAHR